MPLNSLRMFKAQLPFLLLVVLLGLVAHGAQGEEDSLVFRTWQDDTGKSKIEAALIVVKDGTVYLERQDGKIIGVPLKRLSRADQKIALAGTENRASPPGDESPSSTNSSSQQTGDPREALAIAQRETDGTWYSYPALVTKINGDIGYVMTSTNVIYLERGSTEPAPCRLVIHPGTDKQTTIEAELASDDRRQGVAFLRVKADGLPTPPALANEELREGAKFSAYGLNNFTDTAQISFREATVETIRKNDAGDVLEVELAGTGLDELQGSVVVDKNNHVVGFAQAVRSRSSRGTPTNKATLTPAAKIAQMWTPSLLNLQAEPVRWDASGAAVFLTGTVSDPMGRIDKMVLAIKRIEGEPPAVEPRDGIWPKAAADMKFVKIEDGPRGTVQTVGATPWPDAGRLPASGSFKYLAQLVSATKDGQVVYSRPLVVEPNFLGRHWGEAHQLLRAVSETIKPHPTGGLLLTSEKSQAAAAQLPAAEKTGDFPQPRKADGVYLKENLQVDRAPRRSNYSSRNKLGTWADGGDAFLYADQGSNIVRRLSVPDFKAQWEIEFKTPVAAMTLGKEYLLVLTAQNNDPGALWGLDPSTGKVLWRRDAVRGELAASPINSLAVMTQVPREKASLVLLNASNGQLVNVIDGFGIGMPLGRLFFSDDGKYLLAQCDKGLVRFRCERANLILEEASATIEPYEPALSADGAILFAKVNGRRAGREGHPDFGRGMYFYNPKNLSKPVLTFPMNQVSPHVLTLGLASRRLFTLQPDSTRSRRGLVVYALEGEMLHQMENVEADILYVHPDNKRLLGHYNDQFAWINLPDHVHRAGGLAAETDPQAVAGRMLNLLGWEVQESTEKPVEKEWIDLDGGARAAKIPLQAPSATRSVWSDDGKFVFLRNGQKVWRYSIDECRTTHTLLLSRFPSSSTSNPLDMCPDGLLVLYKGQLVLVDPETLLPKRMVVEKVENGKRFLGAPRIKHLIRVQYVSDDGLQVASYDPVTGKDIDTWSMDDHETTERAMRGASFAQLSPDGRHLIIGGRPGLHLEFDEAGKIVGQQKIAMPVEDKIAMPVPMFSSRAVAFYQFAAGVRSFICEMSDTSKMALASDQQVPWLYDDRSSLFWSVDRSGKLIGYDREGKEKIILEHEVFAETLKHYNPSHLATAPPGGGHLLLSSAGTLWVELPKL